MREEEGEGSLSVMRVEEGRGNDGRRGGGEYKVGWGRKGGREGGREGRV